MPGDIVARKKKGSRKKSRSKKTRPTAGLTKKERSRIVKQARKGKDFGKKGKNFDKVANKAAKRYGSKEAGRRVAGAVFWRMQAKKKKKSRK